jgi:hypothetical protein
MIWVFSFGLGVCFFGFGKLDQVNDSGLGFWNPLLNQSPWHSLNPKTLQPGSPSLKSYSETINQSPLQPETQAPDEPHALNPLPSTSNPSTLHPSNLE